MLAALARAMSLPPRQANRLARAAGLRPLYPEHDLDDSAVGALRTALEAMLRAHMPLPAVVTDPAWRVVRANPAFAALSEYLAGFTERAPGEGSLLEWLFAADGLRPLVRNWDEVGPLLLERVREEAVQHPDLDDLVDRLERLAADAGAAAQPSLPDDRPVLTLNLAAGGREFRLFSVVARFGSALDANMDALRIEYFFPEDATTRIRIDQLLECQ